jgi:hypothetical protein
MCGGKNPDGPVEKRPSRGSQVIVDEKTSSYLGSGSQVKQRTSIVDKTLQVGVAPAPKRVPTKKFLDAILSSKELTNALEAFLEAEFCIENLLFIKKTGEYKDYYLKMDIEDEKARTELGRIRDQVLHDFMLPTSENEVNLMLSTR